MTCIVCNAQNFAMSARCLECGTLLIREAVPRSADVQKTVDDFDKKIYAVYGGLGGLAFGVLSWYVFSQDESEVKIWLGLCIVAGSVLGRIVAWCERNAP